MDVSAAAAVPLQAHRDIGRARTLRRAAAAGRRGALEGGPAVAPAPRNADIDPMDAPNPSATPTFASRPPLHVGAIGLKVRDLGRVADYYRDVLGLSVLDRRKDAATLGAGGVALVHLEHRPDAKPDDTRTAGLYHTAFLVPTRADL